MDKELLKGIICEEWKNGACLGYAIKAMENMNLKQSIIRDVIQEMKWLMDVRNERKPYSD